MAIQKVAVIGAGVMGSGIAAQLTNAGFEVELLDRVDANRFPNDRDGVAKGAVLRVPQKGEARANLHAGAAAVKTTLTRRERELCEKIGPALKSRGLIFVGIDVIGDYLTEINVTSPTGLQQIDRFDGVSLESDIWDAIETRRSASGAARPS